MKSLEEYIKSLEGYKIADTHFRIGERIHTNEFYYAKRLFQNSYYTSRIAYWIAYQIKSKYEELNNLTLVGYELYSVLTLGIVCDLLNKKSTQNVNYIYLTNNDKQLLFPVDYGEVIKDYIVVVPISSTGETAHKMINTVSKNYPKSNCLFSIQIITASDPKLENLYCDTSKDVIKMMSLHPKWYESTSCPMCFCGNGLGITDTHSHLRLKPLLSTDPSNLVPIQIFGKPELKDTMSLDKYMELKDTMSPDKKESCSYYGYDFKEVDCSKSLHYLHRIQDGALMPYSNNTDLFIKANEKKIIKWLNRIYSGKIYEIETTDDVVILAPNNDSNTSFVTLVNRELFHSSATILFYKQKTDFVENFKRINRRYLEDNKKYRYFYVDDGLISGKTFFNLYDDFRFAADYNIRMSGAIILSNYSSKEINRRVCNAVRHLHSFVSVNNTILHHNVKIGLDKEMDRYNTLAKETLYYRYQNEFKKKIKDLQEPSQKNKSNLSGREWEEKATKERRHLLMFKAVHYLYEIIGKASEEKWNDTCIDDLVEYCYNNIEIGKYEKDEWEFAIIKVLCQSPFSYYQPITNKVFVWITGKLCDLQELMNNMSGSSFSVDDDKQIKKINRLINRLKFYIRRAVILGNNYIVYASFFKSVVGFIDVLYSNRTVCKDKGTSSDKNTGLFLHFSSQIKYDGLHLYIAKQYIELIHGNHYVSPQLVKSLEKVESSSPSGRQLLKHLDDECSIVLNDLYKIIERIVLDSSPNGQMLEEDSSFNKLINDKIEIVKCNPVWKQIPESLLKSILLGDFFNNNFVNYCKLRFSINHLFDLQKDKKNKESLLDRQIKNIFYLLRQMASDYGSMGAFLIVKDCFNQRQIVYDSDENNRQILNVEFSELKAFDSLLGLLENPDEQEKEMTLLSVKKRSSGGWEDEYGELHEKGNSKRIPVCFSEYNRVILVRITDSEGDKDQEKVKNVHLGLIGFYWKDEKINISMFRKYLLLIREDLATFINSHYQNSEFVQLRLSEERKKYISLFGHGQLTMDKLASTSQNDQCKSIVSTMRTLQYIMAFFNDANINRPEEESRRKILNDQFPKTILFKGDAVLGENEVSIDMVANDIKSIAKEIYKSEYVETSVPDSEITIETDTKRFPEGAKFEISIDIVKFILSEFIINAKKNRFIQLKNLSTPECDMRICNIEFKNKINIFFNVVDGNFEFGIIATSTKIESNTKDIMEGKRYNPNKPIAGVHLINSLLSIMQKDGIFVKSTQSDLPHIYNNTISVRIKSPQKE